jgi:hypothetical protein
MGVEAPTEPSSNVALVESLDAPQTAAEALDSSLEAAGSSVLDIASLRDRHEVTEAVDRTWDGETIAFGSAAETESFTDGVVGEVTGVRSDDSLAVHDTVHAVDEIGDAAPGTAEVLVDATLQPDASARAEETLPDTAAIDQGWHDAPPEIDAHAASPVEDASEPSMFAFADQQWADEGAMPDFQGLDRDAIAETAGECQSSLLAEAQLQPTVGGTRELLEAAEPEGTTPAPVVAASMEALQDVESEEREPSAMTADHSPDVATEELALAERAGDPPMAGESRVAQSAPPATDEQLPLAAESAHSRWLAVRSDAQTSLVLREEGQTIAAPLIELASPPEGGPAEEGTPAESPALLDAELAGFHLLPGESIAPPPPIPGIEALGGPGEELPTDAVLDSGILGVQGGEAPVAPLQGSESRVEEGAAIEPRYEAADVSAAEWSETGSAPRGAIEATQRLVQGDADLQDFVARSEAQAHVLATLEMVARRVRGGEIVPTLTAGCSPEAVLASVLASLLSPRT